MTEETLATPEEVAAYLRQAPKTLRSWRSQSIGPRYFKLANGHVRYSWPDVREWLESQSVEPADQGAA